MAFSNLEQLARVLGTPFAAKANTSAELEGPAAPLLKRVFSHSASSLPPRRSASPLSFSTDTRTLKAGEVFIALSGPRYQGIDYLVEALKKKAAAVIFSQEASKVVAAFLRQGGSRSSCYFFEVTNALFAYGRLAKAHLEHLEETRSAAGQPPGLKIAITGSAGKTSLKELLGRTFKTCLARCAPGEAVFFSAANHNNEVGVPRAILSLKKPCAVYVFEVGMNHPGELERLSYYITPHWTLITNLLPAHLGNFSSMRALAAAKAELFTHQQSGGKVFLPEEIAEKNYFEAAVQRRSQKKLQLFYYCEAQLKSQVIFSNKTVTFTTVLATVLKTTEKAAVEQAVFPAVHLRVPGFHPFLKPLLAASLRVGEVWLAGVKAAASVSYYSCVRQNFLAALLLLAEQGLTLPGRFEVVRAKAPLLLNDAYNANPTSVFLVLQMLANALSASPLRLAVVLGDLLELGERAAYYHTQLGKQLSRLSWRKVHFFFYGENMHYTYQEIQVHGKTYFKDKEDLFQALQRAAENTQLFLFKAANGMHFSSLVKRLAQAL